MILLNTTFYVNPRLEDEFILWVKERYIPSALRAGLHDAMLSLILTEVGENVTGYALHLQAQDLSTAEAWLEGEGGEIRNGFICPRQPDVLAFSTFMEILPI